MDIQADLLNITTARRIQLKAKSHNMVPELKTLFQSFLDRKKTGEDMNVSTNKDVYNYRKLVDALTWMQADTSVKDNRVVEKYKLVFGDTLSEEIQSFIKQHIPATEEFESSSSSSSSKDHAATVISFSTSSAEQVCMDL